MCNRWEDFPKPVELYAIMNMFGINVLTTEGTVWKHHRRIASKAFTEKNNVLVWEESLRQSQAMLKDWTEKEGGRGTVRSVQEDTMKLTLLIISYAGFGVHMDWSGLEEHDKEIDTSEGYTMSYEDALITLLHNVLWVLVLPKWLSSTSKYIHINLSIPARPNVICNRHQVSHFRHVIVGVSF